MYNYLQMTYTNEQRLFLLRSYEKHKGSGSWGAGGLYLGVCNDFLDSYPNIKPPTRQGLLKMYKRWLNNHSLEDQRKGKVGRKKSVNNAANQQIVKAVLDAEMTLPSDTPNRSTARRNNLGLKKSSFSNIVKDIGYRPFVIGKRQVLKTVHLQKRLDFCNFITGRNHWDLEHTVFSDEAYFTLSGDRNSQNNIVYGPKKSAGGTGKPDTAYWTTEKHPQKVMVFLAVFCGEPIGLTFIDNDKRMDSAMYSEIIFQKVIPEIRSRNGGNLEGITWTQDGAPCHRSRHVMEQLDSLFEDRVVALNSIRGLTWPPNSPDFNPLDYFLWGYLKAQVFFPKPKTVTELKTRITEEIAKIPKEMILSAVYSLKEKAELYLQNNGGHFEKK